MVKSNPGKILHCEGPHRSLGRQFPSEEAVKGIWMLSCRFRNLRWVCRYSGLACCSGGSSKQSFGPACLQSLPGFQSAKEDPALLRDMSGGNGLFIYIVKWTLEDVPCRAFCFAAPRGDGAKARERMLERGEGSTWENWPDTVLCLSIVLLVSVPRAI